MVRFVTVAAVMLTPGEDGVRVDYACGGHPPPIVVRHDGRVEQLTAEGQIVGALPAVEPVAERSWLAPGDALVLYSDGFTEVRQGTQMLGETGLVEALSDMAPGSGGAAIVERLRATAASFGPQRDDMALLVVTASPAADL